MNAGNKSKSELLIVALLFVGMFAVWYISELNYARRISPREILTIANYFEQFGEPRAVRLVSSKNGGRFYEFVGAVKRPLFAFPSSSPAYIFDGKGNFVTWSSDPGDDSNHRRRWPLQGTNRVEIGTLKEKFSTPDTNLRRETAEK